MRGENNKGFTLLELLVSMAIVGLALFAFFRMIDSTTRINTKNDRDIKGINLAQSEIENLRSQIKSKGNEGYLEIKDTINPNIEYPEDSDIDKEAINIPITLNKEDGIEWVEDTEEGFVLNIKNSEYTNLKESEIKDKDGNAKKVKPASMLIYKKKHSDNKYYTVRLVVTRMKVSSKNNDTGLYTYKISIETRSDDEYFSKKKTDINEVIILTNKGGEEDIQPPDPPIDPPESIDSDSYLLYCLNRAAGLFKESSKNDLYNLIMVDKVIGNKTLMQIASESNIDKINIELQINKIMNAIKEELKITTINSEVDFINEANYYLKVSGYILKYLDTESDDNLKSAHSLAWDEIHGKCISSYTNEVQNIYELLAKKGLSTEYIYFHVLLPKQMQLFNASLSTIANSIHEVENNANKEQRENIVDKINILVDEIIRHQVYDIEKYIRENIKYDEDIDIQKNSVLNSLEYINENLVKLKAIVYSSNFYRNTN